MVQNQSEIKLVKDSYDNAYPELKIENRYTSPASSLPLYELKLLQEYIHNGNLQNLGKSLPFYKKNLMLIKFFKHQRNRQVEVYTKQKDDVQHLTGKVYTIGRDFVMLKTLFQRTWIPYSTIHSTKSPFGLPNISNPHQHITFDEELRRKLLTQFGKEVAGKEDLRQQFFDQLLETNLRYRKGFNVKVFTDSTVVQGKVIEAKRGYIHIKTRKEEEKIPIQSIQLIKQSRFFSSIMNYISRVFKNTR
jgi:ribosome maturation factor RimP